jgi:hypothetical protein
MKQMKNLNIMLPELFDEKNREDHQEVAKDGDQDDKADSEFKQVIT